MGSNLKEGNVSKPDFEVVVIGGHPYWLLTDAIGLWVDTASTRALLRRLAHAVGGDICAAEPARILRLPGSQNHKYDPPRPGRALRA